MNEYVLISRHIFPLAQNLRTGKEEGYKASFSSGFITLPFTNNKRAPKKFGSGIKNPCLSIQPDISQIQLAMGDFITNLSTVGRSLIPIPAASGSCRNSFEIQILTLLTTTEPEMLRMGPINLRFIKLSR